MAQNNWTRSEGGRRPAELGKPLVDPADWYPKDVAGSDHWIYRLSPAELDEIYAAVDGVQARGGKAIRVALQPGEVVLLSERGISFHIRPVRPPEYVGEAIPFRSRVRPSKVTGRKIGRAHV